MDVLTRARLPLRTAPRSRHLFGGLLVLRRQGALRALVSSGATVCLLVTGTPAADASDMPEQTRRPSEAILRAQYDSFREIRLQGLRLSADRRLAEGRRAFELEMRAARGGRLASRIVRRSAPERTIAHADAAGPSSTPPRTTSTGASNVVTNSRVNSPESDGASATQSEESIAVCGDHVLAAWNDGQGAYDVTQAQGVGASMDGGITFADLGSPPRPQSHPEWRWTSDPLVTVDERSGRFYYFGMARMSSTTAGIGVAWGAFAETGFVWQGTSVVRELSLLAGTLDKPWCAADSATGNVYVCYTNFTTSSNSIEMQRSLDSGANWLGAVELSSVPDRGRVQGARVAVGPGGELCVAWYAIDAVTPDDNIRVRRSFDQGVSFTPEVTPAKFFDNFASGAPGYNRTRSIPLPSLAVDRSVGPSRGRIYLTWVDALNHQDEDYSGPDSQNEIEPNPSAILATPFSIGATLRGALETQFEFDCFTTWLAAGQSIALWADSLTSGMTLRFRVHPPYPDDFQRLVDTFKFPAQSQAAPLLFTAPVAGGYNFLISYGAATPVSPRYRIRTAEVINAGERGRDQRDVFVTWSDDGMNWSTPSRVNDDPPGFDDWLPEVAVAGDGFPYVKWYDHRDDLHGSRTHQYVARSTDGGETWTDNRQISDFKSNFTIGRGNIVPNMGDYAGFSASATRLHATWADTRDADINVYSTAVPTETRLSPCPGDTAITAGATATFRYQLTNLNPLFANPYQLELSADRAWITPSVSALTLAPGASTPWIELPLTVPDTAAAGFASICMKARLVKGAYSDSCCRKVQVLGVASAEGGGFSFGLRGASPNPAVRAASIGFSISRTGLARLEVFDLLGARVRRLLDDELPAGHHRVAWDGRDEHGAHVRAGTYFVRLASEGRSATSRFVFLR